jgi:regulator of cell morphogenesis and NO signaling
MIITAETSVRDIAVEEPTAIPVLEQFGIDYCCGGKHTLAEACTKRNQNVGPVLEELERKRQMTNAAQVEWQTAPLKNLIEHIVQKHHTFTREQLVLIRELADKIERRHGSAHPEVYKLCHMLVNISAGLKHHFSCEENVVFPYIAQLDGGHKPVLPGVFVGIQQPVSRLLKDHDQAGDELRTLREITNNYLPPSDACTTYRALYRALEDLERDMHQHIHLEKNILFPRALQLESER